MGELCPRPGTGTDQAMTDSSMVVGIAGAPTTWLFPWGPRHVCQFDSLFGTGDAAESFENVPAVNATPMLEPTEACFRNVRRDERWNADDKSSSRDKEAMDRFILVTGKRGRCEKGKRKLGRVHRLGRVEIAALESTS